MYKKELVAKGAILTDLASTTSRDTSMVYLATWQMQPYLSQKHTFKQLLLSETET